MGYSGNDVMEWYYTAFQNRSQYNSAPAFLPQYKESHPYCLTIHKIQGLSINKKVHFRRVRTQAVVFSWTWVGCS